VEGRAAPADGWREVAAALAACRCAVSPFARLPLLLKIIARLAVLAAPSLPPIRRPLWRRVQVLAAAALPRTRA